MQTFTIGSLKGWSYGLVLALSAAAALLMMLLRKRKTGLKTETVLVFGLLAVPLCIFTAHLAFWLCSLDWLKKTGASFWNFAGGGYMLYGAVAGGFLAAFLASRICGEPFGRIADAASAPAALMIATGRFAEYLVGAGYGSSVVEWFDPYEEWSMIAWEDPEPICRFPFAVQNYYGTWRFSINLWEGLAAVIFLIVLLRLRKRKSGGSATLLLLMYAVCQIVFESMRRDEVILWGFVRVNQLFSALIVLGILILCWIKTPKAQRTARELVLRLVMLILAAGITMFMEFVLDQKIEFMLWMRADVSYLVMTACSVWMLLNVLALWRKAFPPEDEPAPAA